MEFCTAPQQTDEQSLETEIDIDSVKVIQVKKCISFAGCLTLSVEKTLSALPSAANLLPKNDHRGDGLFRSPTMPPEPSSNAVKRDSESPHNKGKVLKWNSARIEHSSQGHGGQNCRNCPERA